MGNYFFDVSKLADELTWHLDILIYYGYLIITGKCITESKQQEIIDACFMGFSLNPENVRVTACTHNGDLFVPNDF